MEGEESFPATEVTNSEMGSTSTMLIDPPFFEVDKNDSPVDTDNTNQEQSSSDTSIPSQATSQFQEQMAIIGTPPVNLEDISAAIDSTDIQENDFDEQVRLLLSQDQEFQNLTNFQEQHEISQNPQNFLTPSLQEDPVFANQPNAGEYSLFCSDDEQNPTEADLLAGDPQASSQRKGKGKAKAKVAKRTNKVTAKDRKSSAASGFRAYAQKGGSKSKHSSKNGVIEKMKRAGGKKRAQQSSKKPKRGKAKRPHMNIEHLYSSNLIENANANVNKDQAPAIMSQAKAKGLKELFAAMPNADQQVVREDWTTIYDSVSQFTKRPQANGNGGWLHPGMVTPLFSYQVIGAGFMREREKSAVPPHGGFLCDEMGFGKTLQAIANIIDGAPDKNDPTDSLFTTLIVVPPHLINHWKTQLSVHCKPNALGAVASHHASEKIPDSIFEFCLEKIAVILTTYTEVRKSYPDINLPKNLISESDKAAKFGEMFYKSCGPLHRTKFRRIILDEAHEIKNHKTRTSMAVRMLIGDYRWIITGTPIHNNVLELYPYFEFLKIPQIGNFEKFCKTYYPDGQPNHARLANILRAYMMRRTHGETLFGCPLLTLPGIEENTALIKFSNIERLLYREIIKKIVGEYIGESSSSASIGRGWTLMLRLRMFTSHLLAAEKILKKVLTDEVMEQIRQAIVTDLQPEDAEIFSLLEKLRRDQPIPVLDDVLPVEDARVQSLDEHEEIIDAFKADLSTSSDPKAALSCFLCRKFLYSAYILSCKHLYCPACFSSIHGVQIGTFCQCGSSKGFTFCDRVSTLCGSRLSSVFDLDTPILPSKQTENENTEIDEGNPWIVAAGHLMPSSKINAVRGYLTAWLNACPNTKVTVFTQFLSMVHMLGLMCVKEGWGFTTLTGMTPPLQRDSEIESFRLDPSIRVLISSLRSGGTGLNLTMAHKCILVDLWWNEAIEQQAFCRIFRIGQKKAVEINRITVHNSIDDRIQRIQNGKTDSIQKTMGANVLNARDSRAEILRIFGVAEDSEAEGGFVFLSDDE